MKIFFVSLFLFISANHAAAVESVLNLQTVDGRSAYVVADSVKTQYAIVSFKNIRIEIDGSFYRVDRNSAQALLRSLCEPYQNEYPYVYNVLETRAEGFFGIGTEQVVQIDENEEITSSNGEIVLLHGFCQKEMY